MIPKIIFRELCKHKEKGNRKNNKCKYGEEDMELYRVAQN